MSPRASSLQVVGQALAREGHVLRDFLTRIDQPFEWVDPDREPDAAQALLERHSMTGAPLPVVVVEERQALARPSREQLAEALGTRYPPRRREYDLAIIGGGPAGLAAAVYAASDGLQTVVAEREVPGGQASHTARIENYFGIDPLGPPMSGAQLARIGGRQAETFGADLLVLRGVVDGGAQDDGRHRLHLSTGEEVVAAATICATGVEWRRLSVPGLDELLGAGVFYGAGRSEAPGCREQQVVIVGAGNSAGQAALYFSEFAERVTMLARGPALSATLSGYLVERIRASGRIEVRPRTRLASVHGDGHVREISVLDADGAERRLPCDALFIAIGGAPRTEWAEGSPIQRDAAGYLLTGPDVETRGAPTGDWPLDRTPLALESSLPGFFVAGDVRSGSTKRVAAAVGEGAMAVALAHRRLEELRAGSASGR